MTVSRREQAKEERRERILAEAEVLLRRERSTAFSMRELAEAAGVAFATPFNLFESKEIMLGTLLMRRIRPRQLELATGTPGQDPIAHFFRFAAGALQTYTDDEELFRPLVGVVLAPVVETEHGIDSLVAGTEFWLRCLAPARAEGVLRFVDDDGARLARALHIGFRGALVGWARGEVSAEDAERDLLYSSGLLLSGAATVEHRVAIDARLQEIEAARSA